MPEKNLQYYTIYKPFGMHCQFSGEGSTLKDLDFNFPKDVYPVGRLDKDSEGLLILSNDKSLNNRLLNPRFEHKRTYLVQVDKIPDKPSLDQFQKGISINLKGKIHLCKPASALLLKKMPDLPERNPPIRVRKNIPTSWLEITLTEGKNRQVRKMTAKIGHPTLRLVRASIEKLELGDMQSGEVKRHQRNDVYHALFSNR